MSAGGAIDLEFGVIATITNSSFTGNLVGGGEPTQTTAAPSMPRDAP